MGGCVTRCRLEPSEDKESSSLEGNRTSLSEKILQPQLTNEENYKEDSDVTNTDTSDINKVTPVTSTNNDTEVNLPMSSSSGERETASQYCASVSYCQLESSDALLRPQFDQTLPAIEYNQADNSFANDGQIDEKSIPLDQQRRCQVGFDQKARANIVAKTCEEHRIHYELPKGQSETSGNDTSYKIGFEMFINCQQNEPEQRDFGHVNGLHEENVEPLPFSDVDNEYKDDFERRRISYEVSRDPDKRTTVTSFIEKRTVVDVSTDTKGTALQKGMKCKGRGVSATISQVAVEGEMADAELPPPAPPPPEDP